MIRPFPSEARQFPWASKLPRKLVVTKIVKFQLKSRRKKFIGKNSRLDDHGKEVCEPMIRIETNLGISGVGFAPLADSRLKQLIGTDPFDWYRKGTPGEGHPVLGRHTMALWDLAGNILGQPVYQLLGNAGRERVPVYDGSFYFSDLLPENRLQGVTCFQEEMEHSLQQGHRRFKIKIGRGAKWMPREEGDRRDIEVVRFISECLGSRGEFGLDANNGYDLASAQRFLGELGVEPAFVEEMFPENVNQCLTLKSFLHSLGWQTKVADGETQRDLVALKSYIESRALDVLQGDMRGFGFELILEEAYWAHKYGLLIAPHNWGSLIGNFMQLHVAKAIPNFYLAEWDPLYSSDLKTPGYQLDEGWMTVPEVPGFGLHLPADVKWGDILGN